MSMSIFWHSPGKLPTDPTDELGEYLGITDTPRIDHFVGFDRYGIFGFMLDFPEDKKWITLYNNPRIRREIKDFLGIGDPFLEIDILINSIGYPVEYKNKRGNDFPNEEEKKILKELNELHDEFYRQVNRQLKSLGKTPPYKFKFVGGGESFYSRKNFTINQLW